MKEQKITCDSDLLSRFLDKELGPAAEASVRDHVASCPFCTNALRTEGSLSALYRSALNKAVAHANLREVESKALQTWRNKGTPWWRRCTASLSSRRFYVPATAMAALLLFLFTGRHPAPHTGPSAIVKSFQGDVRSVMILEMPKSRRTVLWISENLMANGETGTHGQGEGNGHNGYAGQRQDV